MDKSKILIVEDEILIADTIARYLRKKDYEVVGVAISHEEAVTLYKDNRPNLVLLDIRINGMKSGIDVAHFINEQNNNVPFVFLTSQIDDDTMDLAKETFPAGYLVKPVNKQSLYTTIDVVLNNHRLSNKNNTTNILLKQKDASVSVAVNSITYIKADHVYLQIFFKDGSNTLVRDTFKSLLNELPVADFVQTHRSFVVNKNHVSRVESNLLIVGETQVPISRNRKKKVQEIILN